MKLYGLWYLEEGHSVQIKGSIKEIRWRINVLLKKQPHKRFVVLDERVELAAGLLPQGHCLVIRTPDLE